jgi:integrase
MVLLQLCLGLRVSELLALRWKDVDWMGSKLNVEHGIVNQHLDAVKTEGSRKIMSLDPDLLAVLSVWKQTTEFRDAKDWLFPSPVKLGRLPYSYTGYSRALQAAGSSAGIGKLRVTASGTRTVRGLMLWGLQSQCNRSSCGTVTFKPRSTFTGTS